MMRKLSTQQQVIDALGGIDNVLKLTGANRKQAWHWTGRAGQFPGYTYLVMTRALRRRGKIAADELWSMKRTRHAA